MKSIFSVNHSYEVVENAVYIQQPLTAMDKEKALTLRPIG